MQKKERKEKLTAGKKFGAIITLILARTHSLSLSLSLCVVGKFNSPTTKVRLVMIAHSHDCNKLSRFARTTAAHQIELVLGSGTDFQSARPG